MRRVSSRREKVRQPGADASPHRVTRQAGNREPGREFHAQAQFSVQLLKKEDPGAEEPGSLAGWVRGWGLGGTPPGGTDSTPRRAPGSWPVIIFARCACGATAAGAGAPALAGRPAVPADDRRETQDIANGCEAVPGLRRGPRPHSGCRLETGSGGD